MKVSVEQKDVITYKGDLLIVGMFENDFSDLKKLDTKLNGTLKDIYKSKEFVGKFKQMRLVSTQCKVNAKNLLLVGLGKKEECDLEKIRKLSGKTIKFAKGAGFKKIATTLQNYNIKNHTDLEKAQATTEGTILGNYTFDKYKTSNSKKEIDEVKLIFEKSKDIKKGVEIGEKIANSVIITRDLVNEPPSYMNSVQLAKETKKLNKKIKITIIDKKELEKLGMNAILAVNKGSEEDAKLIIMKYNGGGKKTIALVGKGITFDSGGLNIKPGNHMTDMKYDMAGAATVMGTMNAAAELGLKVNIIGVAPVTSNMVGNDAYKPGDVIKTYAGKTIEILNTDAEGRMVLVDAIAYTIKKFKPDMLIDLATLTGACLIALGEEAIAIVGTSEQIKKDLKIAGDYTYDRVWELPLYKEFQDMVKGTVGDLKNVGHGKGYGGTITAAALLHEFAKPTPWVHLDIAGTAFLSEDRDYAQKGGTGAGVRLLTKFLGDLK